MVLQYLLNLQLARRVWPGQRGSWRWVGGHCCHSWGLLGLWSWSSLMWHEHWAGQPQQLLWRTERSLFHWNIQALTTARTHTHTHNHREMFSLYSIWLIINPVALKFLRSGVVYSWLSTSQGCANWCLSVSLSGPVCYGNLSHGYSTVGVPSRTQNTSQLLECDSITTRLPKKLQTSLSSAIAELTPAFCTLHA